MIVHKNYLDGLLVIQPEVFEDERGEFQETWSQVRYEAAGIPAQFVQDNSSRSKKGVIRGLHYQNPNPQGKLVSVLSGVAFDVAVDIRRESPTFGQWFGIELSAANRLQLWIPPGFAHGFQALEDNTLFSYKCTAYYSPADEATVRWNDPDICIDWPFRNALVSQKDARAPALGDAFP